MMLTKQTLPLVLVLALFVSSTSSQELSKLDRGRAQDILSGVAGDVRKHYYDPNFHGLDWNAKIAEAKRKIDAAKTFNGAMSAIAALLGALDDTHTVFIPPEHAYRHDYGWKYQMIGQRCFVTRVRPKSDAEAKGIKPGDEVLSINGITLDRDDISTVQYVFSILRPQLELVVSLRDPAGNQREVKAAAKMRETKRLFDLTTANGMTDIWNIWRQEETDEHLRRARWIERGDDLVILKLPEFSDYSAVQVAEMIGKARKHKALILDLRGNPGGLVDVLQRLVGGMFDKDVKIGDRVGRKESKPQIAKTTHNPFTGKLIVLVDSHSASSAELFARIMQIEKRGMVLGDRTSGSVMEAKAYFEHTGADTAVYYGASITDADIIMSDGKSLEHAGVIPDEALMPTAKDLANNLDPVLAHAAELAGVKLTPEEAGKLFPYEWPPE
jgi:C-terminal processing protease CtpA/Prc